MQIKLYWRSLATSGLHPQEVLDNAPILVYRIWNWLIFNLLIRWLWPYILVSEWLRQGPGCIVWNVAFSQEISHSGHGPGPRTSEPVLKCSLCFEIQKSQKTDAFWTRIIYIILKYFSFMPNTLEESVASKFSLVSYRWCHCLTFKYFY